MLSLSRAMLVTGEVFEADRRCTEAYSLNVLQNSHQAALVLGTIFLHQHDPSAGDAFADAVASCRTRLDNTPGLYEERYALAAALTGQVICDPRWSEGDEQADLLVPALDEYQRGLEICNAPGVVRRALRQLEMIRVAGGAGLEPAFKLLLDYVS